MSWFGSMLGDPRSGTRTSEGQIQDYNAIKAYCMQNNILFEDPLFSPGHAGSTKKRRDCDWLRPGEISENPKFISAGVSRFDVIQGELGDCWLIAATANLSLNSRLFSRVVPTDQSFEPNQYAGIFHFRFWQFGKWVDVVVDDRLPTWDGKLLFMKSNDPDEFWSSLLEKAYAKLHGSYEALRGGTTVEAMVDFTGGLTEFFEIQTDECPKNLFQILHKAFERQSLIGCSIEAQDESQMENELPNGLVKGHAYSVTCVLQLPYQGRTIPLLRLRNPWSGTNEWNGPWSDSSSEWSRISEYDKSKLGLTFEADGEFWISFQDFKRNFTRVEMCNLGPDAIEDDKKRSWYAQMFEGSWVAGISAGGCRNNLSTFHMNPQYVFTLVDHDEGDEESLCTCIVALMQKHKRSKYAMGSDQLTIGFAIYELKHGLYQKDPVGYSGPQFRRQLLTTEFFKYNCSVARSPTYINLREISARFQLKPGTYCVIPSTFDKDEEGDFILRIWTEQPPSQIRENDDPPAILPPLPAPPHKPSEPIKPSDGGDDRRKDDDNRGRPSYPPFPPAIPGGGGVGPPALPTPSGGRGDTPSYPPYPTHPTYPAYPTYPTYPTYPPYPSGPQGGGGFPGYPSLPEEPIIKPAVAPPPRPGPAYPDINVQEVISTIQTIVNILMMCWSTFQKMQATTSPATRSVVFSENPNSNADNNYYYSSSRRNYNLQGSAPNGKLDNNDKNLQMMFARIAGTSSSEIGPKQLYELLNKVMKKQHMIKNRLTVFTMDTCKSLVATLDRDRSGKLGLVEFSHLWHSIQFWAQIFARHDVNHDGCIDASELREALMEAGIRANRNLLSNMVKRYGNVEIVSQSRSGEVLKTHRSLSFEAFVHCCVKLRSMINRWNELFANRNVNKNSHTTYKSVSRRASISSNGKIRMIDDDSAMPHDDLDGTETAPFTLEEFITCVMYS